MDIVEGFIEKIIFRNEENGYTVLVVANDDDEQMLVGIMPYISEGEYIVAEGTYTVHAVYGEQLQVKSYQIKTPEDTVAIEKYLGSGIIKGIGPVMAARIVKKFKLDTFRIIEEEPERLTEIKGISLKKAMDIADNVQSKKDMREAMIFLQQYGITSNLAVKIYNRYGPGLYTVLRENPYKMTDDIPGVGFKIADEIATRVGIHSDSDFRIRSGMLYVLQKAAGNGHVCLPLDILHRELCALLLIDISNIEDHLMEMIIDKKIIVKNVDDVRMVYARMYFNMEQSAAHMLMNLNVEFKVNEASCLDRIHNIEKRSNIALEEEQRNAVMEALKKGVLVVTGGPGTGKTTTINTIIQYFETEGQEVLLAAPTGRAAKRMTETTGKEAKTIHRLLEMNGAPEENERVQFMRDEDNPLEADVIIVDEMSMVDISLMYSLLKAITIGTRLILVGDVNQLPSVGPGNVLSDIIRSEAFTVVKLNKIFRQAAMSDIVVNAHKINSGEYVSLESRSKDFLFIKRAMPDMIISAMITLVKEKLPSYVNADVFDIQVLAPARKGALGVERLNVILQQYLNPPDRNKREHEMAGGIFREGDKVMQIKNNYQLEWEIKGNYGTVVEQGVGVFNGDIGIIREINSFASNMTVEFDEGRNVVYTFEQLEELELAYAVTIHKSQGSEYPAVVMPMFAGPKMLMNRNLLYTAVTRAKHCVCLVGVPEVFYEMVANEREQQRFSGLRERILEVKELD
ncbi:MAG: ATP-dependent RecD-like DNA helicase [Lachnospiraceae bacterium]|nr:ATP-dependent RecD-like DNA helicase [Lachnospiraceae bacterium]